MFSSLNTYVVPKIQENDKIIITIFDTLSNYNSYYFLMRLFKMLPI